MSKVRELSGWTVGYRVVTDAYSGYEVQCWRLWFPFWVQAGCTNTHRTIEEARAYAKRHSGMVVEYL